MNREVGKGWRKGRVFRWENARREGWLRMEGQMDGERTDRSIEAYGEMVA